MKQYTVVKDFLHGSVGTLRRLKEFREFSGLKKTYAVMLVTFLISLLPMSYEFYIALRLVFFAGVGVFLFALSKSKVSSWLKLALVLLLILYNPFFIIHLQHKIVWAAVNLITLYFIYTVKESLKNQGK